jgi:hypothetical protein
LPCLSSNLCFRRACLCGLIPTLLTVIATGQSVAQDFLLSSGKKVSMQIDDGRGLASRIIFDFGGRNQIVPVSRDDSIGGFDRFPTRSRVIFLPSMKEPLVLAYSSEAGASDCTYNIVAIGIEDGEFLRFVSSDEITLSNEGGAAIWATGPKTTMVVWSQIWAGREGHYDAHRYMYFWYSWIPSRHKFQYIRSTKSGKRLNSGDDSLNLSAHSAVEISYRTRADWFPEAADGC